MRKIVTSLDHDKNNRKPNVCNIFGDMSHCYCNAMHVASSETYAHTLCTCVLPFVVNMQSLRMLWAQLCCATGRQYIPYIGKSGCAIFSYFYCCVVDVGRQFSYSNWGLPAIKIKNLHLCGNLTVIPFERLGWVWTLNSSTDNPYFFRQIIHRIQSVSTNSPRRHQRNSPRIKFTSCLRCNISRELAPLSKLTASNSITESSVLVQSVYLGGLLL